MLEEVSPESRRRLVALALLVVADLARDRGFDALGRIEDTEMDLDEKLAFYSLLDSAQASTIVSLRDADKRRWY
jgi:hypothetical protein